MENSNLTYIFAITSAVFAGIIISFLLERKKNTSELAAVRKDLSDYLSKIDTLILAMSNIHDFSLRSPGKTTIEEFAQFVCNSACSIFNSETGSVMLVNPSTNMLEIIGSRNLSPEVVSTTKLKIGQGIAGKVAETREPIFVEDITKDPRFFRASNVKYNTKSFASVPIEVKGKVLGVLNISPQESNKNFEYKNFIRFITIIANQSAVAFENIRLSNLQKS